MKKIAIKVIRTYQKVISPLFARSCRFEPTCSQYAIEAIEGLGLGKGSLKAARRILRCHPFSRGGYDPVRGKQT
jgi:uncharacterized protein